MKSDVRRTEGLRHIIYIFLGSYLGKVKNFPNCRMYSTDFKEQGPFFFLPPICEQVGKDPSWIGFIDIAETGCIHTFN